MYGVHLTVVTECAVQSHFSLAPFLCRNGFVSKEDYLTFMISRETENVDSAQEVEEAFRAITEGGDKPYVTEAQLLQVGRGHVTITCLFLADIHITMYRCTILADCISEIL